MKNNVLAIDWGGTFIKIGFFDSRGKLLSRHKLYSDLLSKPEVFFPLLKSFIEKMAKKNKIPYKSLKKAGIGIPGIIEEKKGFIYYLPNIKGWKNFAFKEYFEKELKIELQTGNDAELAALGEFTHGAGKNISNGIMLTLGTGIGAGLYINGKIFRSRISSAEAGHMPVNLNGSKCGCGSKGCIETYLGSKYFVKKAKTILKKHHCPKRKLKELTPKKIYELALNKNQGAIEAWKYFGKTLGKFSSGLINLLGLEAIILGGAVSKAYKFFQDETKNEIEKSAMPPLSKQVKIKKAKLGNKAALFGAYELTKCR